MHEDEPDFLLSFLTAASLNLSNGTEGRLEQGITLQMGGILVSGIIVTFQDYVLAHPLLDKMKEHAEKTIGKNNAPDDQDKLPEYIHLKGVKFFLPGHHPIPTGGDVAYWRGRIDRVDGFILGSMAEPNINSEVRA